MFLRLILFVLQIYMRYFTKENNINIIIDIANFLTNLNTYRKYRDKNNFVLLSNYEFLLTAYSYRVDVQRCCTHHGHRGRISRVQLPSGVPSRTPRALRFTVGEKSKRKHF